MAQKANPISFTVRKTKSNFDSIWFNHYNYVNLLIKDFKIKNYINYILKKSNFSDARFLICNLPNKIKINVFFCDNHKAINKSYILKNIYKNKYSSFFKNKNAQKFKTKKNFMYKNYTKNNLKNFKILNYLNTNVFEKKKNEKNIFTFAFDFPNANLFVKTQDSAKEKANVCFIANVNTKKTNNKQNLILNNYINFLHYKHKYTEIYIKYFIIKYFSNKYIKLHSKMQKLQMQINYIKNKKNIMHFPFSSKKMPLHFFLKKNFILFNNFNNILFLKKKLYFFCFYTYYKMQNLHLKNIFLKKNKNIMHKSKKNIIFIKKKNNYYIKFYKILYLYSKMQCVKTKNPLLKKITLHFEAFFFKKNIIKKKYNNYTLLFLFYVYNYARLMYIKINNYLYKKNKKKIFKYFFFKTKKNKKLQKYNAFIIKMHFKKTNKYANLFLNNNFIYFEKNNKYISNSILNNAIFKKTYKNYVNLYKFYYFKYIIFEKKKNENNKKYTYIKKKNYILKKTNKNFLPFLYNKKILICPNYINHINTNIYNSFLCNNTLQFFKTNNFFQNALFLMDIIIYYMEKKITFFKLKNIILKKLIMQKKLRIKGLKVMCSGRVGGKSKKAQKAKIQSFKYGETSLNIFSSKIDFFCKHANTSFGSLGIKIWICYM